MAIREFELFHGAALTKVVRGDRPMTLRMIETRPADTWSAYRINDAVTLLLKHSMTPRRRRRQPRELKWTFTLSPDQIRQLNGGNVWLGLACGAPRVDHTMEICLLGPDELNQLIDRASSGQQSISVRYVPGKSLRVTSSQCSELIVPRNRLDQWQVPGS